MTIFQFLPLEGDPTPEQMAEFARQQHEEQLKEAKLALEYYRKMKLNV